MTWCPVCKEDIAQPSRHYHDAAPEPVRSYLETDDERQLRLEEREAFSTPSWVKDGL